MAVTLVKSAPSSRKTSATYSTSSDKSNGFTRQSSASEQLDQSRRSLSFGRVATLAASQCTDLAAFRRLLDEEQLSRMMKQPQQQQMGGGPALSMRGAMPPMQHTLPMTHRSVEAHFMIFLNRRSIGHWNQLKTLILKNGQKNLRKSQIFKTLWSEASFIGRGVKSLG